MIYILIHTFLFILFSLFATINYSVFIIGFLCNKYVIGPKTGIRQYLNASFPSIPLLVISSLKGSIIAKDRIVKSNVEICTRRCVENNALKP